MVTKRAVEEFLAQRALEAESLQSAEDLAFAFLSSMVINRATEELLLDEAIDRNLDMPVLAVKAQGALEALFLDEDVNQGMPVLAVKAQGALEAFSIDEAIDRNQAEDVSLTFLPSMVAQRAEEELLAQRAPVVFKKDAQHFEENKLIKTWLFKALYRAAAADLARSVVDHSVEGNAGRLLPMPPSGPPPEKRGRVAHYMAVEAFPDSIMFAPEPRAPPESLDETEDCDLWTCEAAETLMSGRPETPSEAPPEVVWFMADAPQPRAPPETFDEADVFDLWTCGAAEMPAPLRAEFETPPLAPAEVGAWSPESCISFLYSPEPCAP